MLAGPDAGPFYAAHTSGRLAVLEPGTMPSLPIDDGPGFEFRGDLESSYGPADRRTTGRPWRELYGPDQLAEIERLVEYAHERHVTFI